jgi:two-component system nitrogen regulation sensor histidine kinase NtrY
VDLQGRQLLLHLFLLDTARVGSELSAVDWLLTGALLSALLALVMTTRIQQRLSSSLRELVALARRLVDGQPVEPIRRPPESDLAEVLDAVSAMNEQVQRRERSLRSQEELLRITLGTLEPAVIVLEPEGSRRYANDSARALEAEHGELLLDQVRDMIGDVTDGGSLTRTVQPVPGRDLTWQIAVAEVPLPEGRGGYVVVVEDVTGLVRADRVRQLNELARIVAHEVKNPLTPVRLWVQELQAALGKEDVDLRSLTDEACREIAIQVERLQETANSFSNLVALEEWHPEPVDLASLARAGPSSPEIFERRGLRFHCEIASPHPRPVIADRTWLRRAVSNLVQNSIDAIGEGPGQVTMRVYEEPQWVVLEVEDSGGGVPDDRLTDLFAPHFSTTNAGSGLGLALVHQVVTRCQGRVRAERGERGLRVRLEFPKPGGAAAES